MTLDSSQVRNRSVAPSYWLVGAAMTGLAFLIFRAIRVRQLSRGGGGGGGAKVLPLRGGPKIDSQPSADALKKDQYPRGDVVDEASWESFPASDPPAW